MSETAENVVERFIAGAEELKRLGLWDLFVEQNKPLVTDLITKLANTLPCCEGINGSHTARCPVERDRLVCWCCRGTFPASWACLWSNKGSRCFSCEVHKQPCEEKVDVPLDDARYTLP